MSTPKTLAEKQKIRYTIVFLAFANIVLMPFMALALLSFGIDPSPAAGIFATAAVTLGAIVIGFFATAPKDDYTEGFSNMPIGVQSTMKDAGRAKTQSRIKQRFPVK